MHQSNNHAETSQIYRPGVLAANMEPCSSVQNNASPRSSNSEPRRKLSSSLIQKIRSRAPEEGQQDVPRSKGGQKPSVPTLKRRIPFIDDDDLSDDNDCVIYAVRPRKPAPENHYKPSNRESAPIDSLSAFPRSFNQSPSTDSRNITPIHNAQGEPSSDCPQSRPAIGGSQTKPMLAGQAQEVDIPARLADFGPQNEHFTSGYRPLPSSEPSPGPTVTKLRTVEAGHSVGKPISQKKPKMSTGKRNSPISLHQAAKAQNFAFSYPLPKTNQPNKQSKKNLPPRLVIEPQNKRSVEDRETVLSPQTSPDTASVERMEAAKTWVLPQHAHIETQYSRPTISKACDTPVNDVRSMSTTLEVTRQGSPSMTVDLPKSPSIQAGLLSPPKIPQNALCIPLESESYLTVSGDQERNVEDLSEDVEGLPNRPAPRIRNYSPVNQKDYYHYRYGIVRKEWAHGNEDGGLQWSSDLAFINLEEANQAARTEAEKPRKNGVAMATSSADWFEFKRDANELHTYSARLGLQVVKVEVVRSLVLPEHDMPPPSKHGWLRRVVYLVQVKTTIISMIEPPEQDALFIEPEEVRNETFETVGDVFTHPDEANQEAASVALERTTVANSRRLDDYVHREKIQKRLADTLDRLETTGQYFKETFILSGEVQVEVWVEQRTLTGPRNI